LHIHTLVHLFRHNVRERHLWPSPFSFVIQVFAHLSRPSANIHSGLAHGALFRLNLAVCPAAARSSTCCAKVPHIIAFVSTPALVLEQFKRFG